MMSDVQYSVKNFYIGFVFVSLNTTQTTTFSINIFLNKFQSIYLLVGFTALWVPVWLLS